MTKQEELNVALKNAESMKEIFDVLDKFYDLENCRPGKLTKAGILIGLDKAVKMVNAKFR